jgi:aldehyde dehydrogenase (NAD+)
MFDDVLASLGIDAMNSGACHESWIDVPRGEERASTNPATGRPIARVRMASAADYEEIVGRAQGAFRTWRTVPPPRRGEVVRQIGNALREVKGELGLLVTLETGKIRAEGEGEVQEMIDICDFAVGLSRQLYGLTIASERPRHRMFEQWHPLGPLGIITAFNFPVAVWAWNAAIAAVCGDVMIWKPSPETPLTAIAVQKIVNRVATANDCPGVFNLAIGDAELGELMCDDRRIPLISATGSCRMGSRVAEVVGRRLGRTILELGGNNGLIVTPSAPLDLALQATLFAAVGTAGQRCTSLRRLFLHSSIRVEFLERLAHAYRTIRIGNPWEDDVLMGPLIDERAVETMRAAVDAAREQGGEILQGGRRLGGPGFFVEPTIIDATAGLPIVRQETFAPILYAITYSSLDEALAGHNSVEQGLTSAIFTEHLEDAERFLSVEGSDCGIANVNIGTSGAEIGGAFGGEKATGGGREAGSDSWKAYMRRQTCTINHGRTLPLAQGITFGAKNTGP